MGGRTRRVRGVARAVALGFLATAGTFSSDGTISGSSEIATALTSSGHGAFPAGTRSIESGHIKHLLSIRLRVTTSTPSSSAAAPWRHLEMPALYKQHLAHDKGLGNNRSRFHEVPAKGLA